MAKVSLKKIIVGAFMLGILALGLSYLNWRYLPFVVTNPDDPRFDPKEFRFANYSRFRNNEGDVRGALAKAFPPGTDKSFVDKILIRKADAWVAENQKTQYHDPAHHDYSYVWSPSGMGGWVVRFIFDETNKSVMMKTGKRTIYGVDPIQTFWEEKR